MTATIELIKHEQLIVGDRIAVDYEDENGRVAIVLRPGVEYIETVMPLVSRPGWRYWCREDGTDREGFISYGAEACVRVIR